MANEVTTAPKIATAPPAGAAETRFVNAMRLSWGHWLAVAAVTTVVLLGSSPLWKKIERFNIGADYRIPYALSKDYWLYQRRLEQITPANIVVIGDSVVWGEYVRSDGTLPHFLSEQSGQSGRFVNAGVNGLFPLAFEGLIRYYGEALHHRKVILHCNLLWMSSPKADLHTEKEERFNHADLVAQFFPRIPCYKADLNHRFAAVVDRYFTFSQWANHLQVAYFGQKNILTWTLEEDDSSPPHYPNAYRNPLAQITLAVPQEPPDDLERGPNAPRHHPWSTTGQASTRFDWVELDQSLQWAAFQRLVRVLQCRENDVLVVVGPFNEHIMAEENRPAFRRRRDGVVDWLAKGGVRHVIPAPLPSLLYADASHPLTEGYELLASRLTADVTFQAWLNVH
jgi:hypothetical protein